ncbi:unnamed protein product [Lupinus luteus]|uniref:F-box domain-containing protein n=1 Tax=Lupinus luteus TaxID=3873 RepID=A0AAV1WIR7_LUPLU
MVLLAACGVRYIISRDGPYSFWVSEGDGDDEEIELCDDDDEIEPTELTNPYLRFQLSIMDTQGDGIFPEEVVIQIMARLTVKSLFRSKSVCKLWYRLSSDKYFIQLYNEVSKKNPMIMVEVSDSSDTKSRFIRVDNLRGVFEFSLDFLNDRVKVRASCNGMLCCSSIPDKGVFYVCNPLTREFRLLPKSRERLVTRFYPDGEATLNQVVFVNNALYWLTASSTYILVLDLSCDIWRKKSLPYDLFYGIRNRSYLLDFDGCLSVIQISEAWMNIWVLKDYWTDEWCMVDKVSLRCIRGMVSRIFPISQTSEYVFMATRKQDLVYHHNSCVWKEMYTVKHSSTLPLWFSAHAYVSSCKHLIHILAFRPCYLLKIGSFSVQSVCLKMILALPWKSHYIAAQCSLVSGA